MNTFALVRQVNAAIRTIPDFPKPGIQFKDISTLLNKPELLSGVIHWMANKEYGHVESTTPDMIVGLDSRGFLFGVPIALALNVPFVMGRKAGKLPGPCESRTYNLEYGTASLELQKDAFPPGTRVMIVDDLLATGGTALAAVHLVRAMGGIVTECVFLTELIGLTGRVVLEAQDVPVRSLVAYRVD